MENPNIADIVAQNKQYSNSVRPMSSRMNTILPRSTAQNVQLIRYLKNVFIMIRFLFYFSYRAHVQYRSADGSLPVREFLRYDLADMKDFLSF